MKLSRHLVAAFCLFSIWLTSCAKDTKKQSTPPPFKSLSQRLEEKNGYAQDADGNWVPRHDKRSSFDTKGEDPNFKKNFAQKQYKAGEYAKKSWWGDKDYALKQYAGNTDGSRFQTKSRADGQNAKESGSTAKIPDPYKTGTYATGAARETRKKDLSKPTDAETDDRQKVYPEPKIVDWQEQRSMSLEQSKGILGH